eukprot:12411916-Karenia_brevis.AAC.1
MVCKDGSKNQQSEQRSPGRLAGLYAKGHTCNEVALSKRHDECQHSVNACQHCDGRGDVADGRSDSRAAERRRPNAREASYASERVQG